MKPLGPASKGVGKLRKLCRAWDRSLQLFFLNEECLVDVLHQSTLTTSLPFVHTARRCYRCQLDTGQGTFRPPWIGGELDPCLTSRGSKSRNKVAVGEPAAGSFRKFSNNKPFDTNTLNNVPSLRGCIDSVRSQVRLVQSNSTTYDGGCLGFPIDEGRGNMR